MADNGVKPCALPMPTPHVANLLVSSYVSDQLPAEKTGLDQLHWTCYLTEPIPVHTKTDDPFAPVSCPLAIEWAQSQTELLQWLWLKKVGKFSRHDEANEYLVGTN